MKLLCPKCKSKLEVDAAIEGCVQCPNCSEELDISALRMATCPICGCGFEESDEIRICSDCKTPHHDECWAENRGCSTYGCASAAHQETHTAGSMLSEQGSQPGMVACPACGAIHPATDLVCGACGKLLGDDLPGDSAWTHMRDSAGRNMSRAKAELVPRLARNFRLLGCDIAKVFRLWWAEVSRYAVFRGATDRKSLAAFVGVTSLGSVLLSHSAVLVALWAIAMLLPSLAICVRRLRDTDISPWMVFAIPLLPFLLLVPSIKESTTEQVKENAK